MLIGAVVLALFVGEGYAPLFINVVICLLGLGMAYGAGEISKQKELVMLNPDIKVPTKD